MIGQCAFDPSPRALFTQDRMVWNGLANQIARSLVVRSCLPATASRRAQNSRASIYFPMRSPKALSSMAAWRSSGMGAGFSTMPN